MKNYTTSNQARAIAQPHWQAQQALRAASHYTRCNQIDLRASCLLTAARLAEEWAAEIRRSIDVLPKRREGAKP